MFNGFSREALDFLLGIRLNNNKEWFEPRKKIYTETIYRPMKELGEALFAPYSGTEGMVCKVGRIYRDEHFPPFLHYRDKVWIYVRYDAWSWEKTPTLYFELSPEGAEFGFRISRPEAAIMERFRSYLAEDAKPFLALIDELERAGFTVGGDEYKRKKPCSVPEAERFFLKKGLSVYKAVSDIAEIESPALAERVAEAFRLVSPLNETFHEFVEIEAIAKALEKEDAPEEPPAPEMIKAPDVEFMW